LEEEKDMVNNYDYQTAKRQVIITVMALFSTLFLNFVIIFAQNYFMISAALTFLNTLGQITAALLWFIIGWMFIALSIYIITLLSNSEKKESWDEW